VPKPSSVAESKSMSLDSLQKTFDNDTCPALSRKETRILWRSEIAGSAVNFPASNLEHSTARSLDALCDPEYTVDSRRDQLGTRYRAATLENLPSATQSDNGFWWINMHPEKNASENLEQGGHRASNRCSMSRRSPPVIEMAREIEHLKSELAAFQTGRGMVDRSGQSAGMVTAGNWVEEPNRPDVFGDRTSSPALTVNIDNRGSPLTQHASCTPPLVDNKHIGKRDLQDGSDPMSNTGDGPGGRGIGPGGPGIGLGGAGMWSEAAGLDQYQNVNELPLVLELRAQVARLQDELRSVTASGMNQSEDAAVCASLLERKSADGNVSTESKAVTHLRRVIQVRNTNVFVLVLIKNMTFAI